MDNNMEQQWSMSDLQNFLSSQSQADSTEETVNDNTQDTGDVQVDETSTEDVVKNNVQEQGVIDETVSLKQQLAQMQALMTKVADATGMQYSNQEDMMAKFNDEAINKLAEKQGVPAELLKRMEMLEANNAKYLEQQRQERLTKDFANLQTKFNLTSEQLNDFAVSLQGTNPDTVNIEQEYVARNFEAIVNSRVEQAVQEALAKNAEVDAHSTTVQSNGTTGEDTPQKLNTVNDLRSYLASLSR